MRASDPSEPTELTLSVTLYHPSAPFPVAYTAAPHTLPWVVAYL